MRVTSLRIVERLCDLCGIKTPTVVVFFATPFCPHNTLKREVQEEAAVCDKIARIAAEFAAESGEEMRLQQFFPSLTDSSYLKIDDDAASIAALRDNFPGYQKLYPVPLETAKALNIPAVNYGVWGKDCHKWTERIVGLMGGGYKVYFSNSGAEAVEGAVKLAKYATERPAVIAFKGSFHGRTMMCASLTASNSAYRKHYEGLMPSIYFAEYPKLFGTPYKMEDGKCPRQYFTQFDDLFKKLVDPYSIAAILMEPVQGEDGYVVPPREWVQYVREICDKYGILLIFDEVQTGFGRTGNMFAWQTHGVKPDIMCCAKGIENGLPLSAVVGRADVMDKWTAGAHGGTFGANPVSCAAALDTIDALEGGAIANGAEMGAYFMGELKKLQAKYPCIGDLRGLGLMIGMEMVYPDGTPDRGLTAKITKLALDNGLFLLSCGCDKNVVRFIAPLTVSKEEIDFAMGVLHTVFAQTVGE